MPNTQDQDQQLRSTIMETQNRLNEAMDKIDEVISLLTAISLDDIEDTEKVAKLITSLTLYNSRVRGVRNRATRFNTALDAR